MYNVYMYECIFLVVCYELFNRFLHHTMKCTHIWIIFTQDLGFFTSFFFYEKKQNKNLCKNISFMLSSIKRT